VQGTPKPTLERVNALFSEVLALAPADRVARLAALAESEPEVFAEVEGLLRAEARGDTSVEPFLDEGPPGEFSDPLGEGARIGPYRLIREIGRGGMGHVYLAERTDEFRMRVAIKIVRAGLSESLRIRFQRERQILAGLDHPNIAKLLDGGTTPQGAPYLVMEYVDGETITRFCEARDLPVADRLALFETVAEAVHHAHRHLVIHRDLKPANILVNSEGVPKLLDFGIAKLLETEGAEDSHTVTGFQPMTPAYASPEQASGKAITTASDVYSLGVILFELVCGSRPYDFSKSSPLEIQRALLETTPVLPSRVKHGLSRDIDSIVSMAMRREPERRYVSAAALADDVRRYLGNFPITARRETLAYQVGRFVRRHRAMVIASTIATVALLAALATALWQSREARAQRAVSERRFAEARKIANSMVFEFHAAIANIPGTTKARAELLGRASEWLDALARDAPDDPALAAELAEAYQRLGNALGGAGEANTGDPAAALAAQRKALLLRERLVMLAPENPEYADRLVAARIDLAYAAGDDAEKLSTAQKAVALAQRLESETPGDGARRNRLGQAYYAEASVRVAAGDLAGAEGVFHKAAEAFQAVLLADPARRQSQRSVSLVNKRLGAIAARRGQNARAAGYYEQALAADQKLVSFDPTGFQTRYDLSVSHVELAGVRMGVNDPLGARDHYRKALAIRETLLREDPANALAKQALASVLSRLGSAEAGAGDHRGALMSLARAEGLLVRNDKESLPDLYSRRIAIHRALGRSQDALKDARSAVEGRRLLLDSAPENVLIAESLVADLLQLGDVLASAGTAAQRREGCDAYAEASRGITAIEGRASSASDSLKSLSELAGKALATCPSPRGTGSD
jgi:eukaryotic-like serine/threonine-protein kinase